MIEKIQSKTLIQIYDINEKDNSIISKFSYIGNITTKFKENSIKIKMENFSEIKFKHFEYTNLYEQLCKEISSLFHKMKNEFNYSANINQILTEYMGILLDNSEKIFLNKIEE